MPEWVRDLLPFLVTNPGRGAAVLAGGSAVLAGGLLILWGMWPFITKQANGETPPAPTGSVILNNPVFQGPAQVGGQGNVMNVNLPAYFATVRTEPYREGNEYRTRVRFIPSPGRFWASGPVQFQIKLSRPCRSWDVDLKPWQPEIAPGLSGGGLRDMVQGQKENTDSVFFGIGDPPAAGNDVVFDIVCDGPFEIVSAAANPNK